MSFDVGFALELLVAQRASEGRLPVDDLVSTEVLAVLEALAANFTVRQVAFLRGLRVDGVLVDLVELVPGDAEEFLVAELASDSVHVFVQLELGVGFEQIFAHEARYFLVVSVSCFVNDSCFRCAEVLGAKVAVDSVQSGGQLFTISCGFTVCLW